MAKSLFYISPSLEDKNYGGSVVAKSNLEALSRVLQSYSTTVLSVNRNASSDCVKVPTTHNKVGTALANLCLLCATLSPKGAYFLISRIRKEQPELIWLDSSLFGILIPLIRFLSRRSKIICYFHNIETPIIKHYAKRQPSYWISYLATAANEYLSIKGSDLLIAIQQTDEAILKRRNSSALTCCIPVSIKDGFRNIQVQLAPRHVDIPYALFVGSDFPPNVEALAYLNFKIAPRLNNKRIIAIGNGIDKYAHQFKNLDVRGRVDDIADFYTQAQIVVAPIFSGGGMKVKIAEALMFNKMVLASNFAAVGYEDVPNSVLIKTDDDETFLNTIQNCDSNTDSKAREYYLRLFSPYAIQQRIEQAISRIE